MIARPLDAAVAAARQIRPEDMAVLAAEGFTTVVNHRPDGEEPGQPRSDDLARAATEAGLAYRHIPVRGAPDEAAVRLTADVLDEAGEDGRILMFCRSGMRSTASWALARRLSGAAPEALAAAAMQAGYDIHALLDD